MRGFIGRINELNTLEREYKRENGFIVIYGRRRVGKTTLIKEFMKDKKALYFLATEQVESENMKSFVRDFAKFSGQGYLADAKYKNWEDVFETFAAYSASEKKVLIIDEFQYLVSGNPAFASVFQRVWDTALKDKNITVILCGSLISMMLKQTLSYQSPLYGRRTAQIKLPPLSFQEISEYFPHLEYEDLVKLYSVTGGVPKYIELFDNDKPLIENIKNEIFSKHGFLFEEPSFLLEKEVKDTISYFSILKTIALGNHKLGDISSALEMKSGQITPYLKVLMDLDILEKRVPVTEKKPELSRKGLYFIKDNFIQFWFRYVFNHRGDLEIDNMKPALDKLNTNFIDAHVSYIFEDISRETLRVLRKRNKIDANFQSVGAYWDSKTEIDVCAVDAESNTILFGECKFHKSAVDEKVYEKLVEKVDKILEAKGLNIVYAIFSKSGFSDKMIALTRNSNIILVDKGKIVTI